MQNASSTAPPDAPPAACLIASALFTVAEALGLFLARGNQLAVSYVRDRDELESALRYRDAPSLALVDFDLPGLSGLPGALDILRQAGETKVVVMTDIPLRYTAARLLGAGAAGVVTRTMSAQSIKAALDLVLAGHAFAPDDVRPAKEKAERLRGGLRFGDLDLAVLRHLCEGKSNAEIGLLVGLPELVIQTTVRALCNRLNVSNRTQAALAAVTAGLV